MKAQPFYVHHFYLKYAVVHLYDNGAHILVDVSITDPDTLDCILIAWSHINDMTLKIKGFCHRIFYAFKIYFI